MDNELLSQTVKIKFLKILTVGEFLDTELKILCFKIIYLFMAVLGLRCCVPAFSGCGERGLLFVAVRGLLIVVASLIMEHGL